MRPDTRKPSKKGGAEKSSEAGARRVRPLADVRPDYTRCQMNLRETLQYLLYYVLIDFCISWLFFSSVLSFMLLLPGCVPYLAGRRQALRDKRRQELTGQFLDGIRLMAAALQAGYSAENALRESLRELLKIYEQDAMIVAEFTYMEAQLKMSRSLEELFLDLARRSGSEDLLSFSEVFLTAKRSGGDLIAVIRNTVFCIRQKQETLLEIETCLAGKMMEQKIMSFVPMGILCYIRLSSPEFLEAMYETAAGRLIMAACFLVYAAAYFWGQKIVRIQV